MAVIQQRNAAQRTSIALTFRILLFVKQLRRRVEPRMQHGNLLGSSICPSVRSPSSRHLDTPASAAPASRNLARDKVQQYVFGSFCLVSSAHVPALIRMLCTLDSKLNCKAGNAFSSIASSSVLFLKHDNAPILEACSMNETIQLLAHVHDAINVLSDCRAQYGDDWLLGQGLAIGLILDQNFIANYEHLLLCLQAQLVDVLARKALEELLQGNHDKKQRKLLGWFAEFADKPQALSTSFPWTIKPSLAVLWGVCWMYYYGRTAGIDDEQQQPQQSQPQPPQQSRAGRDRVRLDAVLNNIHLEWDTDVSSDYVSLGRQLIGEAPQRMPHAANVSVGLGHNVFQARNTASWQSDLTLDECERTSGASRLPALVDSQAGSRAEPSPLPSPAAPLTTFAHLGSDHPTHTWHSLPPQDPPRHLIQSPNPTIRVIQATDNDFFTQPQTGFASSAASSDIYPRPPCQPQAQSLNLNSPYYNYPDPSFNMTDLSPTTVVLPAPHQHKRDASVNSINGDMPTPVSLACSRSPMTSPTVGERPSTATSPPRSHSRGLSVDSSQDGDDDGSLRKNHSYKRAEEPPRNEDGKMVCKYQECHGTSFDRKCEWSKHMDKHDRPYKCNAKGCEKLQGFTYSGGLLRHEREVHKMHGGTKKSLFCPFPDCKRSSGAGFTRKENLAEHIRRVHRRTSMSADLHGLVIRRDMVRREMEGSPIRESRASESPYSRPLEYRDDEDISLKRKRDVSESEMPGHRDNDEMRSEIKRLRQENEEKDSRLKQLEQAVMALQQQTRR
ncbi:hypothetical protein yc1106_09345 [Curvularia clavata]|uniref:C2H2-type domain-containing protein n=1 Tax=Curvularia clavata TaxID=95742 RepID=A0A9Q9DY09_CURCL|nr:hypothetical protein yc1106_09345 [Curvularia clavata]